MKRQLALLLAVALLASVVGLAPSASAAAGDSTDPVITLSYLNEVFRPQLVSSLSQEAVSSLQGVYHRNYLALAEQVGAYRLACDRANTGERRTDGRLYLKSGDVLTLLPGTKLTLISGSVRCSDSHLVNVSDGCRASAGSLLSAGKLYMKDDSRNANLTIASESAALVINGPYTLSPSAAVDFPSRAEVLKSLTLFLGTSYGFELERTTTRANGLVVFIRMMGLEQEALADTGTCPFTDVSPSYWAYRYIAYAYHMGFTRGQTATTYNPNGTMTAKHYLAFMMRAFRYTENTDFTYANLLSDCVRLGLFTQNEIDTLAVGNFTRGRMVYFSYYSLFIEDRESGKTLLENLIDRRVVTQSEADRALCLVSGTRLT